MPEVIVVGGFHEIVELCHDCSQTIIGVIQNSDETEFMGIPVIGRDSDAPQIREQYPTASVVISPDPPQLRKRLSTMYRTAGFQFASLVHPLASISKHAKLEVGVIVQKFCHVSAGSLLGPQSRLGCYANVMHDSQVGAYTTVAPNAVILGYCEIGDESYVGASATLLPRMTVGNNAVVGAGSVVTKPVVDDEVVAGNPARRLESNA